MNRTGHHDRQHLPPIVAETRIRADLVMWSMRVYMARELVHRQVYREPPSEDDKAKKDKIKVAKTAARSWRHWQSERPY